MVILSPVFLWPGRDTQPLTVSLLFAMAPILLDEDRTLRSHLKLMTFPKSQFTNTGLLVIRAQAIEMMSAVAPVLPQSYEHMLLVSIESCLVWLPPPSWPLYN